MWGASVCVCAHVHWFGGLALSKMAFLLLCPHSSGGFIHSVWLRLLQGKPGVAEEQEEDAGVVCMGERGPGAALNRPTKGKKMVQCHGNYSWMNFEWHDMSQAFLSGSGISTSSLEKMNWTVEPMCTQAPELLYIVILIYVQCLMNPQAHKVTQALSLPWNSAKRHTHRESVTRAENATIPDSQLFSLFLLINIKLTFHSHNACCFNIAPILP